MLHVLTAQILADERELAIQRRLRENGLREEARLARAAAERAPGLARGTVEEEPNRPCIDCPPRMAVPAR